MYPYIELPPKDSRKEIMTGFYVEDDKDKEKRYLIIGGARVYDFEKDDRYSQNMAIAMALRLGCQKADVARAFQVHRNTVINIEKTVQSLGVEGLLDGRQGPSGPTARTPEVMKQIARLEQKNMGPTEIYNHLRSKHIKISIASVYRCLAEIRKRAREKPSKKVAVTMENHLLFPAEEDLEVTQATNQTACQIAGPEREESSLEALLLSVPEEATINETPDLETRNTDEKADTPPEGAVPDSEPLPASPPFSPEQGKSISYAGAFLAWPYLSLLGFLPLVWHIYGSCLALKGKLYGVMQSISSFFFLNLLGFDTLEAFKVVDREGFRRLIGAVLSPTVKTLRGKLGILSSFGKGFEFLIGLAKQYCSMGMLETGVLYLDGHFIPYFGKRTMGKGYYTMRRLAHPGRTQHFVNDRNGRPLFFFLREANESFVKLIPELIRETHELTGNQQLTFVFDRGGQSGALFKEIEGEGGDKGDLFITYKKGKFRSMPGGVFRSYNADYVRWGKKFKRSYDLWEGEIKIAGYGNARLILVKKNGHQTPIITNDRNRPAVEVASLMFDRWRQENFFKYMAANYSIDELATQQEDEAPTVLISNPHWHDLEKKIRSTKNKIAALERGIGKCVANGGSGKTYEDERKNPFILKKAALKRMKIRLRKLKEEQKKCPAKVVPTEIGNDSHTVIPHEGKLILDAVKLAVYNAEEWLLDLLRSCYQDWRDPRTVLRMMLQQKGDITANDGVIKVTLHRFGNPSYQKAARGLCDELNKLEARSWDGKWKFEYEVAEQ